MGLAEDPRATDMGNKWKNNIEVKTFLILTDLNQNISNLRWLIHLFYATGIMQ